MPTPPRTVPLRSSRPGRVHDVRSRSRPHMYDTAVHTPLWCTLRVNINVPLHARRSHTSLVCAHCARVYSVDRRSILCAFDLHAGGLDRRRGARGASGGSHRERHHGARAGSERPLHPLLILVHLDGENGSISDEDADADGAQDRHPIVQQEVLRPRVDPFQGGLGWWWPRRVRRRRRGRQWAWRHGRKRRRGGRAGRLVGRHGRRGRHVRVRCARILLFGDERARSKRVVGRPPGGQGLGARVVSAAAIRFGRVEGDHHVGRGDEVGHLWAHRVRLERRGIGAHVHRQPRCVHLEIARRVCRAWDLLAAALLGVREGIVPGIEADGGVLDEGVGGPSRIVLILVSALDVVEVHLIRHRVRCGASWADGYRQASADDVTIGVSEAGCGLPRGEEDFVGVIRRLPPRVDRPRAQCGAREQEAGLEGELGGAQHGHK